MSQEFFICSERVDCHPNQLDVVDRIVAADRADAIKRALDYTKVQVGGTFRVFPVQGSAVFSISKTLTIEEEDGRAVPRGQEIS